MRCLPLPPETIVPGNFVATSDQEILDGGDVLRQDGRQLCWEQFISSLAWSSQHDCKRVLSSSSTRTTLHPGLSSDSGADLTRSCSKCISSMHFVIISWSTPAEVVSRCCSQTVTLVAIFGAKGTRFATTLL